MNHKTRHFSLLTIETGKITPPPPRDQSVVVLVLYGRLVSIFEKKKSVDPTYKFLTLSTSLCSLYFPNPLYLSLFPASPPSRWRRWRARSPPPLCAATPPTRSPAWPTSAGDRHSSLRVHLHRRPPELASPLFASAAGRTRCMSTVEGEATEE